MHSVPPVLWPVSHQLHSHALTFVLGKKKGVPGDELGRSQHHLGLFSQVYKQGISRIIQHKLNAVTMLSQCCHYHFAIMVTSTTCILKLFLSLSWWRSSQLHMISTFNNKGFISHCNHGPHHFHLHCYHVLLSHLIEYCDSYCYHTTKATECDNPCIGNK